MKTNNTWERTLILLKPDAVQRALTGTIIARFEKIGLTITALKMQNATREDAERHYESHQGKPYYEPLLSLLTSGPIVLMAVEGACSIEVVRKAVGSTEPKEAAPGSIRGDYCHMGYDRSKERLGVIPNLIHASDSRESAEKELNIWFSRDDFAHGWERTDSRFM